MARLGRAFPKRAVIRRSQAGKVASGSAVTSGGGSTSASGRKGASSSALTRGGGAVTESGLKHAFGVVVTAGGGAVINSGAKTPEPGSAVTSGGGTGSGSGRKHASGRALTSGGGSVVNSARKSGRGSATSVSGGGSISSTGIKAGFGSCITSGGGSTTSTGENSTPSVVEDGFSFGRPTPDLAGFRAAMRHKRKTSILGEHITFLWAPVEVYASGTVLDPETGQPYDPTIEPDSSIRASATIPGSLAFRAINRAGIGGEAGGEPVGFLDKSHAMVILNSGYSSAVASATHFYARDSEYEIRTMKFDGVTDIDRYLVYGAREGVDPR